MADLIRRSKKIFENNFRFKYFEALYFFRTSNYNNVQKILENKKLNSFFLSNNNKSFLVDYYNLLSKNYEKLKDYSKCLNYALERNKILINLEKNSSFNKKDILDTVTSYTKFFNSNSRHLFTSKNIGLNHSNLAFLVGFPRSGTTLLDTILRAHSKTLVIEEKPYLLNLRHNFFKNNSLTSLVQISEKEKIKIQEKYFKSFNYDPNKAIIDKFPLNILELGFIKTIFPNAKIILAIRHPLDCIISCVLTAFNINEAMLNFENLKTTAYFYDKTFTLLIKYIEYYNIFFHMVKYEEVVTDFDNQIKKLLNYLQLDFEEKIVKFYDTAKSREKIHTPSYHQVVKPLYSNSINRHLNFNEINTIINQVEKWINFYSYQKP
jgi:hypothetical protein